MSEISSLNNLPDISFIDDITIEDLQTELVNDYLSKYKEVTGEEKTLSQSDPNRIILYACSLQLYQAFQYIDRAGKQNLLSYSYGEFLDHLGALKGVTRNISTNAITTLRYSADEPHNDITIPKGSRVLAADDVYFATNEECIITSENTYVDIQATCTESGSNYNGFEVGELTIMVDQIAYVTSVSNTTSTAGGTDTETDEKFSERIFLAPSGYSTAGPIDAYKYWIRKYNSDIQDIKITSPDECEVDIRFTMDGGVIPSTELINGLQEYLEDNNIRPLSDHVSVSAPTIQEYAIDGVYVINSSDKSIAETIKKSVDDAIQEYIYWQSEKIGRDLNPDVLIQKVLNAGAKRVTLLSPTFTIVADTSILKNISINFVCEGLEDD